FSEGRAVSEFFQEVELLSEHFMVVLNFGGYLCSERGRPGFYWNYGLFKSMAFCFSS
ncbi:hypothetical protein L195_g063335, partial [Trifolium pratense]